MRLLIADDDPDSAETLADLLRLLVGPAEVVLVYDGMAALADATGHARFDAVVTDIEMPGLDGITAATRIRRALGDTAPLLVAVTGHVGLSRIEAMEAVFDHVLLKPVPVDDLVRILRARQEARRPGS